MSNFNIEGSAQIDGFTQLDVSATHAQFGDSAQLDSMYEEQIEFLDNFSQAEQSISSSQLIEPLQETPKTQRKRGSLKLESKAKKAKLDVDEIGLSILEALNAPLQPQKTFTPTAQMVNEIESKLNGKDLILFKQEIGAVVNKYELKLLD